MSSIQIYKYENEKYWFDFKTFTDIISKSKDNFVAIYSMTGPTRMGKSFMLSFFIRYLNSKGRKDWISSKLESGFNFRGGSDRETVGIWMWSQPFIVKKKDGTKVSVFLLDTQGCFDRKTSMQDNACVFALSTLLSSVMIFNIKHQLSEDILQFFQYFAGYARLADNGSEEEPYQKLMFLVRDWEWNDYDYGLYDENTSIGDKNFKKDVLNASKDQPLDSKFIRESIASTYADIAVYLMPYPGQEVAKNNSFDLTNTETDFVKHLKIFVPLILNNENIIPKSIGGQNITGAQLLKFVEKWTDIFKCDSFPPSLTIGQATANLQHEMAKTAAIDNYSRTMRRQITDNPGVTDIEFQLFNKKVMKESIDLFKSFKRLNRKEYEEKYIEVIENEMQRSFEHFFQWNSKDRECIELKHQMTAQTNKLLTQMDKTKLKISELKAENASEKQKFEKRLKTNEKKFNECQEMFVKELEIRERVIKGIKNDLMDLRNRIKDYTHVGSLCSIM